MLKLQNNKGKPRHCIQISKMSKPSRIAVLKTQNGKHKPRSKESGRRGDEDLKQT
jgi:hypothetical protein